MKTKTLLLTLAVAFPAASSLAQDQNRPPGDRGARRDGQRQQSQDGPRDGQRPRGPQEPGERPPGPMAPPPLLHALDADDDGIISAAEINNAPTAIATLDKNGDKQVTAEELRPPRPDGPPPREGRGDGQRGERKADGDRPQQRPEGSRPARPEGDAPKPEGDRPRPEGDRGDQGGKSPHGPPPPLIGALDTDHDGVLSAEEIAKSSDSLKTLDKNGDGQLGPREYSPPPPPPGPPPQDGEQKPAQ